MDILNAIDSFAKCIDENPVMAVSSGDETSNAEVCEAVQYIFNTGTATMRTMQHLDKYMDISLQREKELCLGLQRALSDTAEYGCGTRCTSHCLMIFCRDNPEKANELHEAGSSIFRQYKGGFHAFGDDVQSASIRSSGVGAFRRKTNNCVKLLPVGNSTSSVEVVQPILRRHDFLGTGRAKRRQALTDFGTRELPLLMRSPQEGGAGVCVHAARVLIGATPKSFYDGPLAKVLIDENLRRHLPSGSREDRGLLSLEALAQPETGDECCNHHCLSLRGVRSLEFLWDQYERATDANRFGRSQWGLL